MTKVPVRPHEEMLEDHEALQSDHGELRSDHETLAASYKDAIADREALIFNLVVATFDQDTAQRMRVFLAQAGAPLPDTGLIMTWLAGGESSQFLSEVRRHCGLTDEEWRPTGD